MTQLTLEEEIPAPVNPDVPMWSENYCFDAFDADRNIGFYIHMGRWSGDPELWREQVYVYLPDGSMALNRSFGRGDLARGPQAALLKLTCEEPGELWRLQYSGPARRTTTAELDNAPLPDGPLDKLVIDVTFAASGEHWDFFGGEEHKGVAFSQHYEQPGKVSGTIEFAGQQIAMQGVGYRDHSRGARNLAGLFAEEWLHGHFDDGLSFAVFRLDRTPGHGSEIARGAVWQDGKLHLAEIRTTGGLKAPVAQWDYQIELTTAIGTFAIDARPLRLFTLSMTNRFEFFYGNQKSAAYHIAFEQPTSFWRNGARGVGHTERSIAF